MASKESTPEVKPEEKKEEVSTTDDNKPTEEPVVVESLCRQWRRVSLGSVVAIILIAVLSFVIFDENYDRLSIRPKINVFQLSTYWHKLEFVLCYQIVGISWILFNMYYVISRRATNDAINPMSGNEDLTLMARYIMTNSIEQFLMSAFAQIISISFIEVNLLIKIIPFINILFLIGRIAFWLGYPKYRTFGFMCTAIPNTLLINYNLFKFIQNLFF